MGKIEMKMNASVPQTNNIQFKKKVCHEFNHGLYAAQVRK